MNGGGANQQQQQQAATEQTLQVPMTEFPAFFPGQQGLLAQQMAHAFGGSILDHQNAMNYYQDVSSPLTQRPGDVTAYIENLGMKSADNASPATKVKSATGGGSAGAQIVSPLQIYDFTSGGIMGR